MATIKDLDKLFASTSNSAKNSNNTGTQATRSSLDSLFKPKTNQKLEQAKKEWDQAKIKAKQASDNLTKPNVLSTVGRGLTSIGQGLLGGGEALGDALQYGVSAIVRPFNKNLSDSIAKNAQFNVTDYLTKPAREYYDPQTAKPLQSGNIGDQILQGVGQIGAMVGGSKLLPTKLQNINLSKIPLAGKAIGKVPILNKLSMPTTSVIQGYGQGVTQGLDKGASFEASQVYGLGNAGVQGGSEGISGGIGGIFGKGAIDDIVVNSVTKKIKSNIGKKIAEIGIKSTGEGLEENIAGVVDPILQRLTIDQKAKLYSGDQALNDFVVGAATSALLQSPTVTQKSTAETSTQNQDNADKQVNSQNNANILPNQAKASDAPQIKQEKTIMPKQIINKNVQISDSNLEKADVLDELPIDNETIKKYQHDYTKYNSMMLNAEIDPNSPLAKLSSVEIGKAMADLENKVLQERKRVNGEQSTVNQEQISNVPQIRPDDMFSRQVDEVINNTFNKNNLMVVSQNTPIALQKLGVQDSPITLSANKLERIMNESGNQPGEYHGLGIDLVKQLPEAIQNPLDVLKSHDNSYVLTTYLADNQDRPIIASIRIDEKGAIDGIEIDTNIMTSAYGRNNYDNYMKKNIEQGNLVYDADNGIIQKDRGSVEGLQLPNSASSVNNSILQNKKNINTNSSVMLPTATKRVNSNMHSLDQTLPTAPKRANNNLASLETTTPLKNDTNVVYNKKDITPYDFANDNYKESEINQNKTISEKKIETNEATIKTLVDEKNATLKNIQTKIDQKKKELNDKKNKDTKVASQLKQQIALLEKQKTDRETEYTTRINKLGDQNSKLSSAEYQTKEKRSEKAQSYKEQAKVFIKNIANWKDKKRGLNYEINTMERNIRDIVPDKQEAEQIINEYVKPITKHNADIEHFIKQYNDKIIELKLSKKESTAVQMLGEYKYNPETDLRSEQVEKYIADNKLDRRKIESVIEVFRTTYDELITKANQVLKEQGYKEIEYRKGYFPHFIEDKPNGIIGKMAEKLGWRFNKSQLPTDIAGMTDTLRPGKTWFRNAEHRTGDVTDYNALKGFDNYIRGVADIIYHTDDIQKWRALENEIRYQYSDKGIQDEIDNINNDNNLSLEEKEERINMVYTRIQNQMPNFVTEIRKYTDNLANKKDIGDRSMEHRIGREAYNTMTNIHSRLSGNMVGLNVSSAMTNFIPLTQAYSQISTKNMLKATQETIKSYYKDDGFANKSTFLTNRTKQADRLYKTGVEKASDIAGVMFTGIDNLTANIIVRGKYLENISKGMNEQNALNDADAFAKNIIGGRDKGSLPTIFNQKNPVVKLFTAFQLEQANQFGYMFKDMPNDMKKEGIAKLTMAFVKMFAGAWLYNKLKESTTGTKSAFSPIDLIEDTTNTLRSRDLPTAKKITNVSTNVLGNAPFIGGLLGGGRLPISAALPNVGTTISSASNLISGEGNKKTAINNLVKELSKPVIYLVPPFGGGQVKKTIEGLSMYNNKIPGSYTSSGKMRFPVKADLGSKIQAGLFGQYASKNAREYFDKGRTQLSDNQTKTVQQAKNSTEAKNIYDQYMKAREYNRLVKEYESLKAAKKDTSSIEKKIKELYSK